ncbi:alpha/beta-hydrolase [Annulohypoxylon nitens]|nr:alpha/beta-hydrolase [Annulohypoxylon nitens]
MAWGWHQQRYLLYSTVYLGGSIKTFRVMPLKDGSIAIVIVGLIDKNGCFVDRSEILSGHDGIVFDSYQVQEMENYANKKYSLFYSILFRGPDNWEIKKPLHNLLAGTGLELLKCIEISQGGIAFTAKDLNLKDRRQSCYSSDVYFIPVDFYTTGSIHKPQKLNREANGPDEYNTCHGLTISPDGLQIAFCRPPNRIYIHRLGPPNTRDVFGTITGKEWPLVPEGLKFSRDGRSLYMTAENSGRVGLYKLGLEPNASPRPLLCDVDGSVESYALFERGNEEKILVNNSSFLDPSIFYLVNTNGDSPPLLISSITEQGAKIGFSPKQISAVYFQGNGSYRVHAWVMKPSYFDKSRQYPLAILVHGGPADAWKDRWQEEDNPLLLAEQGYIVVSPNITGSTGYGLEFQHAVRNNWGGRPYEDLVKCMEYFERFPNVDINNAVICGSSYGGYMMNWIQGNPLGRRFKAIVSSSSIFDLRTFSLQSDIPVDKRHFGSSPLFWENVEGFERYNPARPDLLPNWKTPMLVVHGTKDFRCSVTEGLGAFHTLQALGTPSRLLLFVGHDHSSYYGRAQNWLEYHRQVFAWLNRFTGITDEAELSLEDLSIAEDTDDATD